MGPMRVTDVRSDVSAKWENRYREVLDAAAIARRWGYHYYIREKTLNSLIGMRAISSCHAFRGRRQRKLTVLDTLPD